MKYYHDMAHLQRLAIAVQLLLGHRKRESTVSYLRIDVDDAPSKSQSKPRYDEQSPLS
jgi:hypothetical protein